MTQPKTDLQEVAGNIYAEIRRSCESPNEGCHACMMVMYIIWKEASIDRNFEAFLTDSMSALRQLHMMNDVKGTA